MNKHVSLKTLIIIVVIIIAMFCIIIYYITDSNKLDIVEYEPIDIRYGDYMEGFKVKDANGKVYENLPVSNNVTILFYLSNTCSSCADVLENYDRIQEIFKSEDISYIFLWYDKIPKKVIEKYNINKNMCYLMLDHIKTTAATPTFYILDKNNRVDYFNSDANLMIKKLLSLDELKSNKEDFVRNSNEYLLAHFIGEGDSKKPCIFFTQKNCHSCEEINQYVESKAVKDIYNIVKIYDYIDMEDDHIKDTYGIFESIYNITTYPSFLIYDDDNITICNELPNQK